MLPGSRVRMEPLKHWVSGGRGMTVFGVSPPRSPFRLFHCISRREDGHQNPSIGRTNVMRLFFIILSLVFAQEIGTVLADEAPKRGGTLTYIIPAEAPPSLDGHREGTFATVHLVAPFYSLLMRVDPQNPSDTTRFDCDLCTAIPKATDDGKTYTFNIREGVKFQDESSLTADDVAASWRHIIFPPPGVLSARQNYFSMVDSVEAPTATTVVFRLKFATG